MLGDSPSIALSQASEYAKEMRKWESTHTRFGPPGRPYEFQEYPTWMFRAEHISGKGIQIVDKQQVADLQQQRNMESRGFHVEPQEAIAAIERQQTEFGRLAAERNFEIAHGRISEKAAAEVRAHEADHGARHLPMIPETPIPAHRKRGRKPNTAQPVEA